MGSNRVSNARIFQVDAFADRPFAGNPAAVCPLDTWPDDATLAAIAAENNLSETAYFVPAGSEYELRWFTPNMEVELCGHATLASAFVLFERLGYAGERIDFLTRKSGRLSVRREGARLTMDFPALEPHECQAPPALTAGLGALPSRVLSATNYLAVFESQRAVADLRPDFATLATLDRFGVIATAPGDDCDFVSRFFAPAKGIPEDPVTGSSHCTLTPYWSGVLGKSELQARQISRRGGQLTCRAMGNRVELTGACALYLEGTIRLR